MGLAKAAEFPWDHIDTKRWPGRELLWCWCHPLVTAVIVFDTIVVIVLWQVVKV